MSTCNGSGEARLEGQQFRIVVLDEASQVGDRAGGCRAWLLPLLQLTPAPMYEGRWGAGSAACLHAHT